jgi:hypothetical protein
MRFAEEMNVLDIVSKGGVAYGLAVGHRLEEFEQFGVVLVGGAASPTRSSTRSYNSAAANPRSTTGGKSTSLPRRTHPEARR